MPESPTYPARAYLNFCPGGITYEGGANSDEYFHDLSSYKTASSPTNNVSGHNDRLPEGLIWKARTADEALFQTIVSSSTAQSSAPHYMPSLSVLAGAVFGRLTGVPANAVKTWADKMVLQSSPLDDTMSTKPNDTTASFLKRLLEQQESPQATRRPCGYVFKRGDIAWNCRTCQADPTCVICDDCFRNSNHDGHEVYFHRTTPGGCCDCGDAEAWALDGCCASHRPDADQGSVGSDEQDDEEAVRAMHKGLDASIKTLIQSPTPLPPRMTSALGVVIGAAVHCLVQAVDGAGIGADPTQWRLRWSDEACRVSNGVVHDEEYCLKEKGYTGVSPVTISSFPQPFRLQLRLHNDDVHTFDDVIAALHEPRHARRSMDDTSASLVTHRSAAEEMTHHVDSDGQVTVKSYPSVQSALQGFRRLKARGLHCAVVSSAQTDLELRARALTAWLGEISSAHPAAAALVVHALVQITADHNLAGVPVWHEPRMIPAWAVGPSRFEMFPPRMASSYLTREESERLHRLALEVNVSQFAESTGASAIFYDNVPYRVPSERYRKSPHALWGVLPSVYSDTLSTEKRHPYLHRLATGKLDPAVRNRLTEAVVVVDTDLRKEQETDQLISSVYPHRLPGLHMISGIGTLPQNLMDKSPPTLPNPMEFRHLIETCSFRAPSSPVLLMLLLDPYPTKQLRSSLHALFLSLLVDPRFKNRFGAALGAVAYRPLSTLFCAGVGTDADTPLGFTVQIFTAGSLVRALGNPAVAEKLLRSDNEAEDEPYGATVGVFSMPIAHSIVRCIHTNLLGSTKEVQMILKNTSAGNDEDSTHDTVLNNTSLLPALTYVAGEHPSSTQLPAAHDDGFLDARSTRHKRLPHLLRDLEYMIETPGTAVRLLLPNQSSTSTAMPGPDRTDDVVTGISEPLAFAVTWARLLRVAQGMDLQKRKISGGHVEYEPNRWLEAFGLSLNFAGTRDALAESLTNNCSVSVEADGSHLVIIREAIGNLFAALLKELKFWLYVEGVLETGLPMPPGGAHGGSDLSQVEALQRSTLHFSVSSVFASSNEASIGAGNALALSCATSVKMTESQLELIESALRGGRSYISDSVDCSDELDCESPLSGPVMGDWLRVPHSPLAGDSLSFHLPLHRAIAKCIRSMCTVVIPEAVRNGDPTSWWKMPVIDDDFSSLASENAIGAQHPLASLIRSTLRSSNCRVIWSSGPDCSPSEAQRRRSRAKTVSANIATAKIIYTLADHPLRCLAAAQEIERYLWARNGVSVAGMALNYSSSPLCRSFRDLDLTLVQLSASGFNIGLGAKRVLGLMLSRFSMEGYLCDPERRSQASSPRSGNGGYAPVLGGWVNPPRLQDPDHAVALAESLFGTLCLLVTELPAPPPSSASDFSSLKSTIRRELLHALAAEPRSHSEAMEAATSAANRRDESVGITGTSGGGGALGDVFTEVLGEIGKQKSQPASRAASGPPSYELRAECCEEYDPTFFHLRRNEHQHAMDTVARLRRQKVNGRSDSTSLPLVCAPPKAHPRFLSCRLLLHLEPTDAALRRFLLFALTGGMWLPPTEPANTETEEYDLTSDGLAGIESSMTPPGAGQDGNSVSVTSFSRRSFKRTSSTSSAGKGEPDTPFSSATVSASSVSFLEVLQLLTLQVHTLEECASLHRIQPDLDDESKLLSAGLSINTYLTRLVHVPESLAGIWALNPYPDGPLPSKGSGKNRGSTLGLLIALYEHRSDHGAGASGSVSESGHVDDGHGGARLLAASGLKWLLRFVHSLVSGASSVGAATRRATTGNRIETNTEGYMSGDDWSINPPIRTLIVGMLSNLTDLWPKGEEEQHASEDGKLQQKSREARKAAQSRVMEMMKKKQDAFAALISPTDNVSGNASGEKADEAEGGEAECIICRCDDADGENNGPLGYLGHVQRSRAAQMRMSRDSTATDSLVHSYRVVGHKGCQLRASEAMDSEQLVCLPTGSIVTVSGETVSNKYDILSRRVLVRHGEVDPVSEREKIIEGWASIQSSEGYVILSPLLSLCYTNTRWGSTRPVIRQCGHAAHLKCVETHTLSLHQRAAGDQPYDGRFAANIKDGEFLCPLCKQLSNTLIPRDRSAATAPPVSSVSIRRSGLSTPLQFVGDLLGSLREYLAGEISISLDKPIDDGQKALQQFGYHLLRGMEVPWERASAAKKEKQRRWHPEIRRWDTHDSGGILSLLRQQHIAWAAVGHSAATAEAAARGIEDVLPFGIFSKTMDPWAEFDENSRDNHPMLLEMSRTLNATSGLYEVLQFEMANALHSESGTIVTGRPMVGILLAEIFEGRSWVMEMPSNAGTNSLENLPSSWTQLMALMASMPCHVARDGTLSQKHEARATAAELWAIRGLGTDDRKYLSADKDVPPDNPPAPFAIRKLRYERSGRVQDLPSNWGSMESFVSKESSVDPCALPFRPAVASAYLYAPLLAWDLNTLSGAVFSVLLTCNRSNVPTASDLLSAARSLLIGRMVQAIVTPCGYSVSREAEEDDFLELWSKADLEKEMSALTAVVSHCQHVVESKSLDLHAIGNPKATSAEPLQLFDSIGKAILPFSRSLLLLLRASDSTLRQRRQPQAMDVSSADDDLLLSLLANKNIMCCEDGFLILKEMGGPLPSAFLSASPLTTEGDSPRAVLNRWMLAALNWEMHHGSRGRSVLPRSSSMDLENDNKRPRPTVEPELSDMDVALSGFDMEADNQDDAIETLDFDEQDQIMDVEEVARMQDEAAGLMRLMIGHRFMDGDGDDSADEMFQDTEMEDAEELVDNTVGTFLFVSDVGSSTADMPDDTSDDVSSTSEGDDEERCYDQTFASLARSPIVPYQPSFLGIEQVGEGKRGAAFENGPASSVMCDLSHLGLVHQGAVPTRSLIRLPSSFVELYNIVNRIRGRDDCSGLEETEDAGISETAICLLTGTVLRSGAPRRSYPRASRPPGSCTLHARQVGSGIGMFFLVQKCTVLLVHNNKSAYSASLYVDQNGEEDPNLRRGRPLFLNEPRYRALETLWRQQGIPREVAQIRSTSDRVIRDNWY